MAIVDTEAAPVDVKVLLDPMRDPAWRAQRALWLVESGDTPKRPRKRDGDLVRRYRRFLIEWRKGPGPHRDKLFVEEPGMYFAHQFHHHPDREWRAILEAKLLAREPDDYIAAEFATCSETIKWYHDLFFDVRDRLHSRMYIVKLILGPSARRIASHDDVMTEAMRYMCYKNFAYFGGPLVLDLLVTGFNSYGNFPTKPDQVGNWIDDAFKNIVRQRSTMTAATFTVDRWKCMELMQMHVALLAQAQQALAAGGVTTEFHQNIEVFFEQIPLAIGKKSRVGRTEQTLYHETTAVEPRASQMLELADGQVPDTLKGAIEFTPQITEDMDDEQADGQAG